MTNATRDQLRGLLLSIAQDTEPDAFSVFEGGSSNLEDEPMTRYILIENNSGYIWADTIDFEPRDETPEQAARRVDETLDARHAAEHSYTFGSQSDNGYHIYRAPKGFRSDYGGQDQDAIEAVERECSYVGYVAVEAVEPS